MVFFSAGKLSWVSYAAMVPMALLLAIGGAYWRAKYLQLTVPGYNPMSLFKLIRRLRSFSLIFTIASLAIVGCAWRYPAISAGINDRITATIASLLALAEYVNYYHRQLQHFDNASDFKRLLQGRGFRRSQMAVDLDTLE